MIIGLLGVSEAGKTTFANMLKTEFERRGKKAKIMSIAGPIRDGLSLMGICKCNNEPMYREAAQALGAAVRKHKETHWVESMLAAVHLLDKDTVVIIDDVRYENEIAKIKAYVQEDEDLVFYYLYRPDRDISKLKYQHESEALAVLIFDDLCSFICHDDDRVNYRVPKNLDMEIVINDYGLDHLQYTAKFAVDDFEKQGVLFQ